MKSFFHLLAARKLERTQKLIDEAGGGTSKKTLSSKPLARPTTPDSVDFCSRPNVRATRLCLFSLSYTERLLYRLELKSLYDRFPFGPSIFFPCQKPTF